METLFIEAGKYTPEVILNPDAETFSFSGKSFPVNPLPFYEPIIEWFEHFLTKEKITKEIVVKFEFDYINTASSKQIAMLLTIMESSPANQNIKIEWHYDPQDSDILETGLRFSEPVKLNFKFVTIESRPR